MLPIVKQIAIEFKAELQKMYGDNLAALILFGSQARGDYHEESDIDFAVVLKELESTPGKEIFRISPISVDLDLKYGHYISFLPLSYQRLSESQLSIHRFIKSEGIPI